MLLNDADDHVAGRQTGEVCLQEETHILSSDHLGLSKSVKENENDYDYYSQLSSYLIALS